MKKHKKDSGMMFACCVHGSGLLHVVAGVGIGFLLMNFFPGLENLLLWGAFLVGVALVGHFMGKME